MKTENWNGHEIRFVHKNGEWWAVAADVAKALCLRTDTVTTRMEGDYRSTVPILDSLGRNQETYIINEPGIYDAIFKSRKKEAKQFKSWVYSMLKELRQATGLEGFQIFRMLDKEHQKEAMAKLNSSLRKPVRVNFIKANTIADKAISTQYGYSKMLKKAEMTPEMLLDRQPILDETVNLMSVVDKFGLDISVSQTIYNSLRNLKGA